MRGKRIQLLSSVAGAALLFSTAVTASAQDRATGSVGPNRSLLRAGAVTLAAAYVPAVAVAATSERYGDGYLYVPVAGPWLDLAHRSDCSRTPQCDREWIYKGLIITDGVVQGIGSLQLLGAVLFSQTQGVTTTNTSSPGNTSKSGVPTEISIRPAVLAKGYGVVAAGRFSKF